MHDIPVLRELLLIAGASLAVVLVFQRLRIPPTIGFIVTGILIGPGGFGLVRDAEFVRTMAEIGVVLLLFTVGLEFSLTDLRRLGRTAIIGGGLQVLLTLGLVAGGLIAFGMHPATAIFLGMLAVLSSTAVVLKLLSDRLELEAPHGRLATAVLIFQDLMAVVFLLAVPALGAWLGGGKTESHGPTPSIWGAAIVIALFVLLFAGGQRALRWMFVRAARSRSREAFLFGVVVVALGSASLAAWAGLSLALGAFLAGLLLAESDFREQVAADVLPFRDTLASVFFISLGMSFLPASVIEHPGLVFGSAVLLVVIKLGAGLVALRLAGASWRVAFAASLALAQIGEFSFMIAQAGEPSGLFSGVIGQAFFASAVFSLMLTPLLVARAPDWALQLEMRITAMRMRGGSLATIPEGATEDTAQSNLMSQHVVIAGFGLNGRNLARVLRSVRVKHVIVDLNAEALATEAGEGSPVLVGDITQEIILKQAGVTRARVLVLAISDPTATRQACRIARRSSHDVHIIVRTRQVSEIDGLFAVGANQVIPEEFETSIEIFTAVLRDYHVPNNVVQAQIRLLRQERYSLLRGRKLPGTVVDQLETIMQEGTTDTFLLLQHSPAVGKKIGELGIGDAGDCALVALVRGGRALQGYDETLELRVGDTLVMTGNHASMDRLFQRLRPWQEGDPPQSPVAGT
jgi:CPA2 family monovalent cation:H+ antiporter-2